MPLSAAGTSVPRRLDQDRMARAQHLVGELDDGAHQGDLAVVEQRDAVANALHAIEQVRGQQHRDARLLEAADHLQQLEGGVRIEARGRLVEDRHLGLLHHDLGDAEPLAHAARVGRDALVGDVGELHAPQRLHDARLGLAPRDVEQARGVDAGSRAPSDCRRSRPRRAGSRRAA